MIGEKKKKVLLLRLTKIYVLVKQTYFKNIKN